MLEVQLPRRFHDINGAPIPGGLAEALSYARVSVFFTAKCGRFSHGAMARSAPCRRHRCPACLQHFEAKMDLNGLTRSAARASRGMAGQVFLSKNFTPRFAENRNLLNINHKAVRHPSCLM
jgi:hypothetical protein